MSTQEKDQAVIAGELIPKPQSQLKSGGRPKGSKNRVNEKQLSAALQKRLKSKRLAAQVADVVIDKALNGNLQAIDMLWTRAEGKPSQGISNTDSVPFEIKVIR